MQTSVENQPADQPFPIARLDLEAELARLRESPNTHGHVAKTLLHTEDLRLVLMLLRRGMKVPEHRANGSLTAQVLEGRVVVTLLESSFDLGRGQVLAIERGVPHALVAIDDSALLLTIAWNNVDR